MKIGTSLLKLRKERRLSQAEVADQLGVCQSTYCAWESDRSLPNAKCYIDLAVLFGVEIGDLTSHNGNPTSNHSHQQLVKPNDWPSYEDLAITQKQLITLQEQKIEQLEIENRQLRQQIQQIESKFVSF